ncbi:sigma-70 family RNA polymerase sigma factor [Pseudomonas yangonensis]|uniref:sigma-70 family RNA polymerase sigma factor n=1 Tax=Pseudomonas yangonensis TaxID=2579922 RepID=UPI00137B7875|nr:sigma-70 family RNA polymerase sigma factor [Pseudomonas yangonensis]
MSADAQVLHTLYRDHHSWLQGWLRRRLGNGCDAADLAQDTFVRLLRAGNAASIREPRDYLATVARGLMVDFLRRRSLEQAYLDALALQPQAEQPSAEQQALLLEALMEVDRMLAGLGRKVREVFILSQLDGLAYAQIAACLGISLRSVNSYMARAVEHCCLLQAGWRS